MTGNPAKHLFLNMKLPFCLLLFFLWQNTNAQFFENGLTFTTRNGLSNNNITCLEKDEEGFLWIGTHEGLNQYDGTEFVNVLRNEKNNLPSNVINKICCINKTTLAISTRRGLCLLNTKTLEGTNVPDPSGSPSPVLPWDILYNKKQKELWVGTADGLYVFSTNGKLIRKIKAAKKGSGGRVFVFKLFMDRFDNIFFYSTLENGFFYPDFEKNRYYPIEDKMPDFPLNKLLAANYYLRGASYEDNKIICCFTTDKNAAHKNIISYYDNKKGNILIDSFTTALTKGNFIFDGYPAGDSLLILNSFFGEPFRYNIHTRKISSLTSSPGWFTSWPDGISAKILVVPGNIWVASFKGLLQFPQHPGIFKSNSRLTEKVNTNKSLVSYNSGIYYNNKFWLSCLGAGVFVTDTLTGNTETVFTKYIKPELSVKIISNDLLATDGNRVWLFSQYGPAQINSTSLQLDLIEAKNKDSLFDNSATAPFKDSKGNIWASVPAGIEEYVAGDRSFISWRNKLAGGSFPLEKALYKTEDGKGNIWFARGDTLVKLNPETQQFSTLLIKREGVPLRPAEALASDGGDLLYMCLNESFAVYHISTGEAELFTKQTGVVSTAIQKIIADKHGNAWIATEAGLLYYNKTEKKFYSYTKADGLPDDNIISLNFADESKSVVFLGFSRSYCLFSPEKLLQQRTNNCINTITAVEVNGRIINPDIEQEFSYEYNSVGFYFTGINFSAGAQNSYAYMLEGFEREWRYSGKKRQCNYINLPPGSYTFKIKSANQQGEWNEIPASYSFTIRAPFWQTWWFRLIIACMAIGVIYWFIKRRDILREKENKITLQMSELKLTALQSQMNPHFIFNSLNSIQNYIMQQKPVEAARYLSKFSKLMRRILDQSFNNLVSLQEIVETLNMYMELEAFRFSNEFKWELKMDDPGAISNVKLPPLLVQPFVENAIIHGLMPKEGDKKLLIHLFKTNEELHCVIDDNGAGRNNKSDAAQGHISRGEKLTADMLATMKQLLHTNARIIVTDKVGEDGKAAGTKVDLIIPMNV